jgi:hypothetical protein
MDSLIIIIIVGVFAIGGSLIGGFRFAKIQNRGMRKIRPIGTIILLLAVGIYYFLEFQDSVPIQDGILPTEPQATVSSARIEMLELDQTTSYTLNVDDEIALTYEGELGQVVTLTIIPETGTAPTIQISSQVADNSSISDESIAAQDTQTIVCGYQFTSNGTVTFLFQATESTSYTVEFVDGNTCQNE